MAVGSTLVVFHDSEAEVALLCRNHNSAEEANHIHCSADLPLGLAYCHTLGYARRCLHHRILDLMVCCHILDCYHCYRIRHHEAGYRTGHSGATLAKEVVERACLFVAVVVRMRNSLSPRLQQPARVLHALAAHQDCSACCMPSRFSVSTAVEVWSRGLEKQEDAL